MKRNAKKKTITVASCPEAAKGMPLHPYLKEYLGYCFMKSALRIRLAVDRELAPFGVIAPQFGMLIILLESGSMNQIDLGSQMAIDKATMVRMIDGLEEQKLLTRAPSSKDRRANILQITSLGIKAIRKMDIVRKKAEAEVLSHLSATEQAQLRRILCKLITFSKP